MKLYWTRALLSKCLLALHHEHQHVTKSRDHARAMSHLYDSRRLDHKASAVNDIVLQ